jgi:hypothetical protein
MATQEILHLMATKIMQLKSTLNFFVTAVIIQGSVRPKAWVCGRSFGGIAGSDRVGGRDVCPLCVLCVVR